MDKLTVTQADMDAAFGWTATTGRHGGVYLDDGQLCGLATAFASHRLAQSDALREALEAAQSDNTNLREKIKLIADIVIIWTEQPNPTVFPTRQRDAFTQRAFDEIATVVSAMADEALGRAALQEQSK